MKLNENKPPLTFIQSRARAYLKYSYIPSINPNRSWSIDRMQKWSPLNYSLVFVERSGQTLGATRIDSLIRSQTLKWLNHVARMENFMPQKVEMLFASNQNKNERDQWTKLEQQSGFDKLHLNWGKRWWTSQVFTVGSTATSSHQLQPIYRPRSNTTVLYCTLLYCTVLLQHCMGHFLLHYTFTN